VDETDAGGVSPIVREDPPHHTRGPLAGVSAAILTRLDALRATPGVWFRVWQWTGPGRVSSARGWVRKRLGGGLAGYEFRSVSRGPNSAEPGSALYARYVGPAPPAPETETTPEDVA
jgi:hypothetical protein